jgi:hypothetical protein
MAGTSSADPKVSAISSRDEPLVPSMDTDPCDRWLDRLMAYLGWLDAPLEKRTDPGMPASWLVLPSYVRSSRRRPGSCRWTSVVARRSSEWNRSVTTATVLDGRRTPICTPSAASRCKHNACLNL